MPLVGSGQMNLLFPRMPRGSPITLVVVFGVFLALATTRSSVTPAASASPSASGNPFVGLPPPGAIIYFVPLDTRSRTLIASVVPSVQKWLPYAVQIKTIPRTQSRWINKSRSGEWNGAAVANDSLADFKSAQGSREVFILAVTSKAMYDPRTPYFSFVFGGMWRHLPDSPLCTGLAPRVPAEREKARLTKMMLRYIGQIVCKQQRNNDRRSVLDSIILGMPDLDRMVATLPAVCRVR